VLGVRARDGSLGNVRDPAPKARRHGMFFVAGIMLGKPFLFRELLPFSGRDP
jgi:hypothetical protein